MPHPAPLSSMFLRHLALVDEELTRATHTAEAGTSDR